MADKETKQKSTTANKASTSGSKSSPKATKPSETKSTVKTTAAKPTAKSSAAKPAEKAAKAESAKTASTTAKTTKTTETNTSPESVVAKYSNPSGRKPLVVEETTELKKAPKSQDAKVAAVVEKHANSRGAKTTVVAEVKKEKAAKDRQARVEAKTAANGEAAARRPDTQTILLWVLIGLLIAALTAGLVLTIVSASTRSGVLFVNQYKSAQAVGFYSQQIGTTERVKPVAEIKDGGLPAYPVYGKTLSSVIGTDADKVAARNAIIRESSYLTATGTSNAGGGQYTWMDKNGYLYSGSTSAPVPALDSNENHRQLYQHTASVGLYGGNVSDDEPGIIKQATFRPRGYTRGYNVTGVYAAAGEVVKIEISGKDMDATGGIVIHIGQALYNGKANNIWAAKNQMQRFPVILNTMSVTKDTSTYNEETDTYTAYVGSFVGGPLYIRNESVTFSVTISGGVAYSHFILGYTTPEEFEQNAKSSAPYFDLEVWSYGVLHSGPKSYASKFTYDDLYKAAVLWEKVSLVSTTGSLQGIVFLYDPFVAAGAAVAFPGQGSVNCPASWMPNSLNYNAIVSSGSWGNFHEYHHNFQGYGVGAGGEVTNNAMTLVSYALFTKVSSARSIGNYGAAGMSGWNRYTSATWALEQTLRISRDGASPENGNRGLSLYATLLHNFGPDNFIQAKIKQRSTGAYGENYAGYLQAWQDVTHYDMSYYFNDILGAGLGNAYSNSEYPMFIPVSSVYQTGRGITQNGNTEYIETMQPYVLPYGESFTLDLRKYDAPGGQYSQGSIVTPDGFDIKVKNVSQPEHGTITQTDVEGIYTFTPDKTLRSGKIIVTLEIVPSAEFSAKYPNAKVEDVDLVLEFEQTHEKNKLVLDRTIYTYAAGSAYTDAEDAYNNGFKGYESVENVNHSNPTQNANTDIWFVPDTDAGHTRFPNALDFHVAKDNTITVIEGKLYAEEEGKYRIYLRGRLNCAVYYSIDGGKTYQLGATIKDDKVPNNSAYFRPNDENTYFDLELGEKSWVYFKEVLITQNAKAGGTSYIGLGMKQWQEPIFTIQTSTDANGNEVTKYFNHLGVEVSEEEANSAELLPPTISNNSQPYVNAYKTTYEQISGEFTSDYFYTRDYSFNYQDNELQSGEQQYVMTEKDGQTVPSTNYNASISWNINTFKTEYLVDGNRNTFIHTKNGWGTSESKAVQFVIDLGEEKTVNRMILFTQNRPNGDWHAPKNFTLEGSLDGVQFTKIGDFENVPRVGLTTTVNFDETAMRYYRLTVTGSHGNLLIIGEIEMWNVFEVNGAKQYSPNDESISYYGKWKLEQALSNFGQVYVGSRGASIKFEIEGSRFGILSSKQFDVNYEVLIDGKVVTSVSQLKPIDEQKNDIGLSFLSDVLNNGKHTVEIKCKGEANFDSFVVYPDLPESEEE